MRLAVILLALSAALALAVATDARPSQTSRLFASLPPGWAKPNASATSPKDQIAADTSCGSNSVLLFSARGSGDQYGAAFAKNKIGAWTQGAGLVLIKNGWNVRDLQAIYPAPPVPSFTQIAKAVIAGGGVNAKSGTAVALIVKTFRDAASNSWQSVKAELEAAYARCPTRKILLAGYSQGAILLRYIVPRLGPKILAQVVSVDLIADPTEQRAVDSGLQHPANLDGRLTNDGIDTFSGRVVNAGSFRQTPYPKQATGRVYQYCMDGDLVCDFTARNLLPTNSANEGKIHASYGFELVGIAAGRRLGTAGGQPIPGGAGTVTAIGRIGPLQLGESGRKDVVAFGGKPDFVGKGTFEAPGVPDYIALAYDCSNTAGQGRFDPGAYRPAHVHCRTIYFLNGATKTLGGFLTSSAAFRTPAGTRPGMNQA